MGIDVLVVGSLHRDVVVDAPRLPRLDETLPGSDFRLVLGGKGANQAVAAARMGARTAMAGRVGRDDFGDDLLAGLDAAHVDRTHVSVDADAGSGMSVAIVTEGGEYGAVIVSGANLALRAEDAVGAIRAHKPRVLLIQNEIPVEVNRAAAAEAAMAGATVVWNAAPARDPDPALLANVSTLLVNRVEAATMAGVPVASPDEAAAAARVLSASSRDTIVTLGAAGAIHAARDGTMTPVPAIAVEARSAHGAGDMFAGALAARLATGEAVRGAMSFATGAAALFVSSAENERAAIDAAAVRGFLARTSSP